MLGHNHRADAYGMFTYVVIIAVISYQADYYHALLTPEDNPGALMDSLRRELLWWWHGFLKGQRDLSKLLAFLMSCYYVFGAFWLTILNSAFIMKAGLKTINFVFWRLVVTSCVFSLQKRVYLNAKSFLAEYLIGAFLYVAYDLCVDAHQKPLTHRLGGQAVKLPTDLYRALRFRVVIGIIVLYVASVVALFRFADSALNHIAFDVVFLGLQMHHLLVNENIPAKETFEKAGSFGSRVGLMLSFDYFVIFCGYFFKIKRMQEFRLSFYDAKLFWDLYLVCSGWYVDWRIFWLSEKVLTNIDVLFPNASQKQSRQPVKCGLCQESCQENAKRLRCGHVFHAFCLYHFFIETVEANAHIDCGETLRQREKENSYGVYCVTCGKSVRIPKCLPSAPRKLISAAA